eukprot:2365484-Prorocentrum_lima.AAC.1
MLNSDPLVSKLRSLPLNATENAVSGWWHSKADDAREGPKQRPGVCKRSADVDRAVPKPRRVC